MEAKHFCEVFCDPKATKEAKLNALRNATRVHSQLVKECARGKGVDRHLFALRCIAEKYDMDTPSFFNSAPWKLLNHTVLSTSNCGNPSLAQFGFGPVVPDGFGIGYIIKDSRIMYSISSKHRQTVRYASTLESVLREMATLVEPASSCSNNRNVTNTRAPAAHYGYSMSESSLKGFTQRDSYGDIWGESTPPTSPRISRQIMQENLHLDDFSMPKMMMMPDMPRNISDDSSSTGPTALASGGSSTFVTEEVPMSFSTKQPGCFDR